MKMEIPGFIGVHVGAGKYSEASAPTYEKLCRTACKKGIEILKSGGTALEAATYATAILEDASITNAGFGSNLTIDGNVECDASVMDGSTLRYGAVGALSGVKNPVLLAKKLCCNQSEPMELGRIPPCVLVGHGAYDYAQHCSDIITVHPESLVSKNALKLHTKYMRQLGSRNFDAEDVKCDRLDTVGAVAIDGKGHTSAACSSGGILLKHSGRVGQAAMYGCGCWAEDGSQGNAGVAVTTSGCGEHIMKAMLARDIAGVMSKPTTMPCVTLNESMNKCFLESNFLRNIDEKLCGMLVIRWNGEDGEFLWAHTTPALCIGYMNTNSKKAKSRLSCLPATAQAGKTVVVEGISMSEMN
ncbi:threonine aspartase 1 [Planococcus citri]|uniref:threonine aspartase 1 n=1 Tax=Planococcus citri TaxID=170843 RepID=UPI0031FA0495